MVPNEEMTGSEIATLAGGCFWCTEAIFQQLKGVQHAVPGYAGGRVENPDYRQVCSGTTGHTEAVQITFDPTILSFHDLLAIFFTTHDPTTLNRQGADVGTQYRSAVFYHSPEQQETARQVIREIEAEGVYSDPIVTEVTAFTNFYEAEDYHHNYYVQHGGQSYCQYVIAPKVSKFRAKYRSLLNA